MKNPITLSVAIFCVLFFAVIVFISTRITTITESALAALFFTLISIVATWVVGHFYASHNRQKEIENLNESHEKSLRMYALKAAEKVMNLSRELDRLSAFLLSHRDAEDETDLDVVLRIRDERITSAIHIVNMLKSVNDTGLSDWEGVIGEELDKKREKEEEQEEYLKSTMETIETIIEKYNLDELHDSSELRMLRNEVRDIRNRVNLSLHAIPSSILSRTFYSRRTEPVPCPECGNEVPVKINKRGRPRIGGLDCKKCGAKLFAIPNKDGEPKLFTRELVLEKLSCPTCSVEIEVQLENVPGGTVIHRCDKCDHSLRASRTAQGITVKEYTFPPPTLDQRTTPEFVAKVKKVLPSQPWPTGIHKEIATELETSPTHVQKAIKILIQAGVCKNQIDGEIVNYEEYESKSKTTSTALTEKNAKKKSTKTNTKPPPVPGMA